MYVNKNVDIKFRYIFCRLVANVVDALLFMTLKWNRRF